MAQSLARVLLHFVFSTKNRQPFIRPEMEPDLYAYIGGICRDHKCTLVSMGGTDDHVHMLVVFGRQVTIADLLMDVKKVSSKWAAKRFGGPFEWQDGYAAFSIGESGMANLKAYIRTQKEHHRRVSFQDELRAFFRKYGVEFDERYVWD